MFRKLFFTLLAVVMAGSVWVSAVSAGQEKVTVCHKPGTPAEMTLEIASPALNAHLGHGDYEGACTGPQSDGCAALNAIVPDPQTDPIFYFFAVSDLDFFPGETIHVDMTISALNSTGSDLVAVGIVGAFNSNADDLAQEFLFLLSGEQGTVSVDYVVVDGDDADGAAAIVIPPDNDNAGFTLDDVNFSCTPAP